MLNIKIINKQLSIFVQMSQFFLHTTDQANFPGILLLIIIRY